MFRHRPRLKIAFGAAALGIVVVAAAIAAASTLLLSEEGASTPAGEVGADVSPTPEARPALRSQAAGYADRHDVSYQEAVQQLEDQPAIGELAAALKRQYRETLSGAWIEHEPYGVFVRFKGSVPAEARAMAAARNLDITFLEGGLYTFRELERLANQLVRQLRRLGYEEFGTGFRDNDQTVTGTVRVQQGLPASAAELKELLPAQLQGDHVIIEFIEGPIGEDDQAAGGG
ncbi:MAG: hypothetical protein WEB00_01650 [Dehalococcoidia bacterium]